MITNNLETRNGLRNTNSVTEKRNNLRDMSGSHRDIAGPHRDIAWPHRDRLGPLRDRSGHGTGTSCCYVLQAVKFREKLSPVLSSSKLVLQEAGRTCKVSCEPGR